MMERTEFYSLIEPVIDENLKKDFVKESRILKTDTLNYEKFWQAIETNKESGYITSRSKNFQWHCLLKNGEILFTLLIAKGVKLYEKDSLLGVKNRWLHTPFEFAYYIMPQDAIVPFLSIFAGTKTLDRINPDTSGIDHFFNSMREKQLTGSFILETHDDKAVFLYNKGLIIHIISLKHIDKPIPKETVKELILAPTMNITAIETTQNIHKIKIDTIVISNKIMEFNNILQCFLIRFREIMGYRVTNIVAGTVKQNMQNKHPFLDTGMTITTKPISISLVKEKVENETSVDFITLSKEILSELMKFASMEIGIEKVKHIFSICSKSQGQETKEKQ